MNSPLPVIIKREHLTRVESKGFIIGTVLTPLLLAALLLLPSLLMNQTAGRANYRLIVLDQTEDAALYERAERLLTAGNERHNRFQVGREVTGDNQLQLRKQELN